MIYRLLENHVLGPELVNVMTMAYEDVLDVLQLPDRDDPLADIIARRIVELALSGQIDPKCIPDQVLQSLDGDVTEAP
ncbi:MAG: hypothetical protein ACLPKB_03995 [Xanthobacteraceae bacterium]